MDLIDKAKDFASDAGEKIGDTFSGIFEGVKETADSVLHPIDTLLGNWGSDLLEGSMKIANKTTFDIPNIQLISTITNVFVFATTTFAICIVMYKVLEAQIQASNGSPDALTANIVQRLFYSSIALAVLPWAMNFFIKKIVAPIGEYVIQEVAKDLDVEVIGERIRTFLTSTFFSGGVSAIVLFVFVIFFAFSIAKYFIAICVFYADFLVLTMLTPLVALSLLTDEQNYFQIWIKELLSEALTMLIKLILYLVMISLMVAEKYSLPNFMVMIGCGLLIIKTPSALQNMWYSTKVSRGGGLSNLALMAMFRK
ncbi:conjugal transfer protein TrbL family protein [Enterococcus faecium]|uniref:TrsL n=2 Tax=Enterococcus faecium TaxID=1352 RepID=A0A242AS78_ENTFC|nr:conjugal transfer protein TrbL family protein [Enterococcus faecium]OTN83919.1 hypothetical protein A5810_003065 [Enterococcus faecium]